MSTEDMKRREFIKKIAGFGVLGLACGAGIYAAPELKTKEVRLRPPGAVPEDQFLQMCIKCGQCLQVCPYNAIELEGISGGASEGMAFIDPRSRGCYLCPAFPCMLACPTGALDHFHNNINYVHMGMAYITDINSCLALNNKKVPESEFGRIYSHSHYLSATEIANKEVIISGNESEQARLEQDILLELDKFRDQTCSICASLCPYPTPLDAIGMIKHKDGHIPEIREACVGCGACVELCPVDIIKIEPWKTYSDIYGSKG